MITRIHFVQPEYRRLLRAVGRHDYESIVDPQGQRPVHKTTHSTTYHLELPADWSGRPQAVYLKIYRPGHDCWKYLLRVSKSWLECYNLRRLAQWGVPVVRPVAMGSRRSWCGLVESFLMTEDWSEGTPLDRYAAEHWSIRGETLPKVMPEAAPATSPRQQQIERNEISRLIADGVRRMHEHCFSHVDLQWRNILVRRCFDGRWDVAFLDSPRGRVCLTWPGWEHHGRVSDLASMDKLGSVYFTRAERMRWLLHYLGCDVLDARAKALVRRVLAYRQSHDLRKRLEKVERSPA